MDRDTDNSSKSILNWAGLGLLIILIVGAILVSRKASPLDEPSKSTLDSVTAFSVSEPLAVSPLSTRALKETSPVPSPTAVPSADFQIAVLHTNDTWGYLLPCG
jgi:hypothetical protein